MEIEPKTPRDTRNKARKDYRRSTPTNDTSKENQPTEDGCRDESNSAPASYSSIVDQLTDNEQGPRDTRNKARKNYRRFSPRLSPTNDTCKENQPTEDGCRDESNSAGASPSKIVDQLTDNEQGPKPDSSPTDATGNTNRLKEDEQRNVSDRRRAKKQAWTGDGKKYDEVKSDLDEEITGQWDVRAKYENYALESYKREQQWKKQIRELEETLTVVVAQREQAERDLRKERREQEKEYQDAIDLLERDNRRLESECVELQQALRKMKKDFQHESKQREQLSYKYSLLEKQSQAATNTELLQNSDRKKELMDLNHKVEELMKEKAILHTQNQSLCRSLNTRDEELHHVMNENRQLLQKVKGADSMKVSDLQRKLTKVNQELAELRADNSALQQDKQLLQNKFDHMEEEMKIDQENKSDEQKMALSQLQREVAALQREKSDLIKKAEQVKSNNESQLKQQQEEIDQMKTELKKKDKLFKENDDILKEHLKVQLELTANTAELNRKYESMMSKNKDLQGQVKDLTSREETLCKMLENQRHQNQLLGKKIHELNDAIERLDRDKQELHHQNQQLMFKRDSYTQEYQQTSAAAKAKIDMLQKEISDLRKRTADSEERVESASETIHELEWEKRTMEAKIKELNKQIQELNARQDSYTQQYQQMSSAAEEKEKLRREITGLRKRITDSDGSSRSALEKVQREKEKLETENQRKNEQIQKLNERQDSQRQEHKKNSASAAKENERLQREITDLRNRKKDSELTVKSTLERVEVVEGEKAQLKAEIQRQADQIQDLKTQCEEADQVRHDVQHALKENEEKTKQSSSRSSELEDRLAALRKKLANTEKERDKYLEEKNTALTRLDSTQEFHQMSAAAKVEIGLLQREIPDLRKHTADSEERGKSAPQRIHELEGARRAKRANTRELNEQIQELNSRNKELSDTIHSLRIQLRDIKTERDELQEEQNKAFARHAQVVMDISPREMAMRLRKVYRSIEEMVKRDKSQTDKSDTDKEDMNILSDLKALLQKYYTLMEQKFQNNEVITDVLDKEFLEVLPAVRKKFDMFSQAFFEICRDMFSLTQPPILEFGDGTTGSTINRELFNCYEKPGEVVDYVIWPALVSRCDGSVFEKGIVKPQVLTK